MIAIIGIILSDYFIPDFSSIRYIPKEAFDIDSIIFLYWGGVFNIK